MASPWCLRGCGILGIRKGLMIMAIQKISIENFTVFEKIEIDFCEGVNIFIGENGTGKTHLLKLLYCFSATVGTPSIKHFPMMIHEYFDSYQGHDHCLIKINEAVYRSGLNEYGEIEWHLSSSNVDFSTLGVNYVFIPAKEMLSMSNIIRIGRRFSKELRIDPTLIDIVERAQELCPDGTPELAQKIIPILENIINGTIFAKPEDLSFWVRKRNGLEIPFAL